MKNDGLSLILDGILHGFPGSDGSFPLLRTKTSKPTELKFQDIGSKTVLSEL